MTPWAPGIMAEALAPAAPRRHRRHAAAAPAPLVAGDRGGGRADQAPRRGEAMVGYPLVNIQIAIENDHL